MTVLKVEDKLLTSIVSDLIDLVDERVGQLFWFYFTNYLNIGIYLRGTQLPFYLLFSFGEIQSLQIKIKALIYTGKTFVIRDGPYFAELRYFAIILGDE